MAWEKLKRILGLRFTPLAEEGASVQQLVNQNLLNRRTNFRVQFPSVGPLGPYPRIFHIGTELLIGNISVGGCLVIDDTEEFGTTVGDNVNLEFVWLDYQTRMRARIVGANLEKRHIQFLDFNAQLFLRINKLVPAAMTGHRFHRVQNDSGRLAVAELWTSHTKDTMAFDHDGRVELFLNGEKYFFHNNNGSNVTPMHELSVETLSSIFVLLANIPNPSRRVLDFIEGLAVILDMHERRRFGTDE